MTVIFEADSSVSHEGFSASYRMFDSREGKCKRNFNPFESKTFNSKIFLLSKQFVEEITLRQQVLFILLDGQVIMVMEWSVNG